MKWHETLLVPGKPVDQLITRNQLNRRSECMLNVVGWGFIINSTALRQTELRMSRDNSWVALSLNGNVLVLELD